MQIKLAETIGYCQGVKRSIAMARQALQSGLPVYTLGPLIHNEYTTEKLAEQGIGVVDEGEALRLKNGILVIRAHGTSQSFLHNLCPDIQVIDATCPSVAVLHRLALDAKASGRRLVIAGHAEHDEIQGVLGDAGADTVVVATAEEAATVPADKDIVLIAQTTFDEQEFERIEQALQKSQKNSNKLLASNKTICYTTIERRKQSVRLAKQCDAMVVIGSRNSANTCALVELCRRHCDAVHLCESAQDTGKIKKQKISTLGVTTGASTPTALVTEVVMSIEEEALKGEEVNTVDTAAEVSSATTEAKKEVKKPITSMEDVLEAMVEIKPGAKLECHVLDIRDDGLVVDCGQKKEGFIAAENCGLDAYNTADYNVGDTFYAKIIENKSNDKSMLTLSKKAVDEVKAAKQAREEAEKEMLSGKFDVTIGKKVNRGLLATKGDFTIFIPASHIELDPVADEDLDKYVGQTITVKKLPPKKDEPPREGSKRIVASRRLVLLAERRAAAIERKKAREERIAKEEEEKKNIFEANKDRFEPNNIVPGVVKKFVSFGVFVNVYGFDCLCPTSEISWVRNVDATTVLEQGKEYEFLIIKVDAENYKVTLSYKQIQRQPYELAAEKYPVGTIVKGTVQSLVKFGAFVSIEPGIDGLVHISNISTEKIESPADVLKEGDEIEAKVISFKDNRIALSIKDVNAPAADKDHAPRANRNKKFDRPATTERRPKKAEEPLMSEEEKENIATYDGGETTMNNAFADILKGLNLANNDEE